MSADASNRLQQPGIALKLKHYTGGVRLGEALMERMKNSRLCPRVQGYPLESFSHGCF
jgi:hypothetical protein